MKLAVISDLHLGRGDLTDRFGHDDAEFLRFLKFLENNHERIVLLGDIFETLEGPRHGAHVSEIQACQKAHPEISKRIRRPEYIYIYGNHDSVAERLFGAQLELQLIVDNMRIHFVHGHLFDWLYSQAKSLGELIVWIGGWIRRLGASVVCRLILECYDWLHGMGCSTENAPFLRWAMSFARQRQADIIVTGHTHHGMHLSFDDGLYLNSGTCSGGRYGFLSLDTGAGEFQYCQSW